jgi:hypothetical protein
MSHIVDEVVLNLGIAFLAENDEDGEYECNNKHNREHYRRDHEPDTGKDVGTHVGEMDLHHTHFR